MQLLKLIISLFIFLNFIGCSKIILKKVEKEVIPFKIEKGNYEITINSINYPDSIEEKEKFYNDFDIFSKKLLLNKNKLIIMLDDTFFADYELIKKGQNLEFENIVNKVASSLTDSEKATLEKIVNIDYGNDKSVQKFLNMQIYFLMKILSEESNFKKDYRYTELDKENLINKIKIKRQKMLKILEMINIEMIVKIKDIYKEEVMKNEYKNFYFCTDIVLSDTLNFDKITSKYSYPVYISNLSQKDFEKIFNENISLKNKFVFLVNNKIEGYKYLKGDLQFFLCNSLNENKEKYYSYEDYKISITEKKISLTEAINIDDKNSLSKIFTGK